MTQTTQSDLFQADNPRQDQVTGLFADIIFDRPLDHAYSYQVPDELRNRIAVGKRVRVPFGRGDRAAIGYCVHLGDSPPGRTVKTVLDVIDEEALLTPHLLRLTRWMADYYLCGWGQVLNGIVPAGAKAQAGTRATLFVEAVPEAELQPPLAKLSAKQTGVLEVLRHHGRPIQPVKLAKLAKCGSGPIKALLDKKTIRRIVQRVDEFAIGRWASPDEAEIEQASEPRPAHVLNADQNRAWEILQKAIVAGGFRSFLLYGVTGSGKTELYLRAIEEVMRQGKEALVLVPEISLTPQTIAAFRGRRGDVAVLHSHLGNVARGGHWRRILQGQVQVVVGARSAVFAPTHKLGLIVVDEEHEGSFKEEATPRYHARDVAVMRARLEGIPIVLGSATPSLESWHNAQRGQYTLLTLPKRVLDRPLPRVSLIDLRHDGPRGPGIYRAISPSLEKAMRITLADGGQVILLLNRRGFSTYVHCPACGYVEQCKFCDLSLTYHRQRDVTMCHHCGYDQPPPERCPKCGLGQVRYQGLGTEKLQAEIEAKFAGYVVRRMDSDSMRRPGSYQRVLSEFRSGEIHILMGTQMIAKGLDFPNVTLVGVVNADVALHLPDFRAAERTFQLLAQVAGRTGRGPRGGRVFVQTYSPEHPAIACASVHDFRTFVGGELAHRQEHQYPPYQRMARVIVRSREQEKASQFAERLAEGFRSAQDRLERSGKAPLPVRLLGPAEAPVFRLKGNYRVHFQLQSPSAGALHQLLRTVLPTQRLPSGVAITLDVDPYDML